MHSQPWWLSQSKQKCAGKKKKQTITLDISLKHKSEFAKEGSRLFFVHTQSWQLLGQTKVCKRIITLDTSLKHESEFMLSEFC